MSSSRKTSRSMLRWIVFAALAALALALVSVWPTPARVRMMYAEWAAVELIVTSQQKLGRVPATWQEMQPWYETSNPRPRSGLAWDDLQKAVSVNFQNLQRLAESPAEWQDAPRNQIITPHARLSMHWVHPERELARHFSTQPPAPSLP